MFGLLGLLHTMQLAFMQSATDAGPDECLYQWLCTTPCFEIPAEVQLPVHRPLLHQRVFPLRTEAGPVPTGLALCGWISLRLAAEEEREQFLA